MIDWLNNVNITLFIELNRLAQLLPAWFWSNITHAGDGSMLFAFFTLLVGVKRRSNPQLAQILISTAFLCLIFAGALTHLMKWWFDVLRPPMVLNPEQITVIGEPLGYGSFPSGHSVAAFLFFTIVSFGFDLNIRQKFFMFLLASLIAFSRIAVGAHWPFDVLVGSLLGCVFTYLPWQWAYKAHQHFRFLRGQIYSQLQWWVLLLNTIALFFIPSKVPQSIYFQYVLAAAASAISCQTLFSMYRSNKNFDLKS